MPPGGEGRLGPGRWQGACLARRSPGFCPQHCEKPKEVPAPHVPLFSFPPRPCLTGTHCPGRGQGFYQVPLGGHHTQHGDKGDSEPPAHVVCQDRIHLARRGPEADPGETPQTLPHPERGPSQQGSSTGAQEPTEPLRFSTRLLPNQEPGTGLAGHRVPESQGRAFGLEGGTRTCPSRMTSVTTGALRVFAGDLTQGLPGAPV